MINKRLIVLIICCSFFSNLSFSQEGSKLNFTYHGKTIPLNPKVIDHFGTDKVNKMMERNIEGLLFWNYYADNACKIESLDGKPADIPSVHGLLFDNKNNKKAPEKITADNFNILDYSIERAEKPLMYKLDDGDKFVYTIPRAVLMENFRNYAKQF